MIVKEKSTNPDFCTILTINSAFFIIIPPTPWTNRCFLNQLTMTTITWKLLPHLLLVDTSCSVFVLASGAEELPMHTDSVSVWNNLVRMQPRMPVRQPRRWQCNLYEEGHVGQSEAWRRKHQWWVISVWTDGEVASEHDARVDGHLSGHE